MLTLIITSPLHALPTPRARRNATSAISAVRHRRSNSTAHIAGVDLDSAIGEMKLAQQALIDYKRQHRTTKAALCGLQQAVYACEGKLKREIRYALTEAAVLQEAAPPLARLLRQKIQQAESILPTSSKPESASDAAATASLPTITFSAAAADEPHYAKMPTADQMRAYVLRHLEHLPEPYYAKTPSHVGTESGKAEA